MPKLSLILHNIRSAQNVGSIFRTADALGVSKIYLTGYTPYPKTANDTRLPHVALTATNKITKTALGAEANIAFEHHPDLVPLINELRSNNITIYALEQAPGSKELQHISPKSAATLIAGNEVEGLNSEILNLVDEIVEIPMRGKKESLNVAVATAIATYKLLS